MTRNEIIRSPIQVHVDGTVIRHRFRGESRIPTGSWPERMCAAYAAGYCGELTIQAFRNRVGREYPLPRVTTGRRELWLRDDLDKAIKSEPRDAAEDL